MDKRKLSALPREEATDEMLEVANNLNSYKHIVTAELIDEKKILLLNFYDVSKLKKGKREATFRTFLSSDDYITQDLKQSKVKWLTASFYRMDDFECVSSHYDYKTKEYTSEPKIHIRSEEEQEMIMEFFKDYVTEEKAYSHYWCSWPEPWEAISKFQDEVIANRLEERHNKELVAIDKAMEPFAKNPEQEFFDWCFETGMSFSRYVIYKEKTKGKAECQCTYCKTVGTVNRDEVRLRNNEKGECPFCGSKVTFKAKGKLPSTSKDERWFVYVHPTDEGFALRFYSTARMIFFNKELQKIRLEEYSHELKRVVYTFPNGKLEETEYEWGVYKQRGHCRWCPSLGKFCGNETILYPGNLPKAWEHTPMKYSALEVLATNIPTISLDYKRGMMAYMEFPKLEWLCKMGLNMLAKHIINTAGGRYGHGVSKINYSADTIYKILGLTKENVRVLQEIDANHYELCLMQVAQSIGLRFKPEQLREYYETFECNTDLLKATRRKVSLHKLVKYITKESENYPLGEKGRCWQYSCWRYTEREDPRIERKRNCAHDWLEYLNWCKELKYDLNNMFIYMPNNFKKVHDRIAEEYKALQDKKAAVEKRRREKLAAKKMAETKKAMEEIFSKNDGVDAFQIKGKGLILVVPQSGDEIRKEGETLHHCVGGYVERVARGETNIFFVRKADAPEKPYFTMEWRDNKIIQCRGFENCGMPAEVQAFVKVFEKKMTEAIQKETGENKSERKAG